MTDTDTSGAVGKAVRSYFREFGALKECGREFWVVQLVNLLDGVAYFAMLTVSTLYLSETLGYDDAHAANLWAACMAVYTGVGFVAGFIGDSLGIKRTLHLSVLLLVASRLAISATTAESIVIPALFVVMVGTAIMTPILIAATKRYTTAKSQTAGFNMLYFLMNIGAFLGNWTLDPARALPWGNRSVFMVGSTMSILCWVAILVLWRKPLARVDAQATGAPATDSMGERAAEKADGDEDKKWEAPWTVAASVFKESAFWRFILFLVILVGVRLVFEHQYQVYPKYYMRTMSGFAFAADASCRDELDAEKLSTEARQVFDENQLALSGSAKVSVEADETTVWRVRDGDRDYGIEAAVFDVAPALYVNLSEEETPPELLRAFDEDLGIVLSDDAKIVRETRGIRWSIEDKGGSYVIRATDDGLDVYDYPKKYLGLVSKRAFSIERAMIEDLDARRISRILRQAFEEHGHALSNQTRITSLVSGREWKLNDKGGNYTVLGVEGELRTYKANVRIGALNSINPFIICFGVILSTPIVARFKLFNVMFFGICISAGSMLLLVVHPVWFCGRLGWTLAEGYGLIVILQIIAFSIGEAIWSPRLYEYTAAIAPKGREASYMGLSYAPMFFARFAEGPLAGKMLTEYCPPDVTDRLATVPYTQSPQFMCVILAAIAIASPVLILVFRGVIQKGSRLERDEELAVEAK